MKKSPVALAFLLGACAGAAATRGGDATPAAHATKPGGVVKLAEAPLREAPSGKARVRLLTQGDNAFLGKLMMDGGAKVPEHQDPTEEYIHVLTGGGKLTMDGVTYEIGAGDTVLMPAGATVSFENGPEPMEVVQVFAGPGPAKKYDAWVAK